MKRQRESLEMAELAIKKREIFHTTLICSSAGSFGKEVNDVGIISWEEDMRSIARIEEFECN
jgi:hypothetical protein